MPLDFTIYHTSNSDRPLPLDTVSRSGVQIGRLGVLEQALRAEMPDNFQWNFHQISTVRHCGTAGCAIGLAIVCHIMPKEVARETFKIDCKGIWLRHYGTAPSIFGLSAEETDRVFFRYGHYGVDSFAAVTPIMVAADIAAIIAREIAADSRASPAECVA